MVKLLNYQEKHVSEFKKNVEELLKLDSNKICIFESPTGSGKTIMIAELIKRLVKDKSVEMAFVWITVHNLHKQSRKKLEKYYDSDKIVQCSLFEDLQYLEIQDKEILFLNWESVNKENNKIMRDDEREYNLPSILKKTQESGRIIILIIDESHNTAKTDKSKEIIKKINPKLTIEVSATPKIMDISAYHMSIDLQKVKEEEIIKKTVKLNPNLSDISKLTKNELILREAIEKRKILKQKYENIGSSINPLILIQLPDKRQGHSDKKDEVMKILDSQFNINLEKGNLATHLSNNNDENKDREYLENIEKNDNPIEVLIFKQALTIGWDCPRSSILVLFREWGSIEFSIQTIGRIIRMPERKYYDEDELNHAYVYTNIDKVKIAEDMAKDYITTNNAIRNDDLYDEINIPSIYQRRRHDKTRYSGELRKIFLKIAHDEHLEDRISMNDYNFKSDLIINATTSQIDKPQTLRGDIMTRNTQMTEIQEVFDSFIIEMVGPFALNHSMGIMKRMINRFFETKTGITDLTKMAKIVLEPNNKRHFTDVIQKAVSQYQAEIVAKIEREFENITNWNVPKNTEYTNIYTKKEYKKCIMKPSYIKVDSELEVKFMDFIDADENVKWWFKNGANDIKYFAVKYYNGKNEPYSFYVDFVIYMNDGRIGLFDTKEGYVAEMAKTRAEGLFNYIKNNKNKNCFGGIATHDKRGWLYNNNEKYSYDESNLSDWKLLDFVQT